MLQTASIIFCDCCEAASASFERAWRAYVTPTRGTETYVTVACPDCAERVFGEDEAPWSD
jgi:hypothetical protein